MLRKVMGWLGDVLGYRRRLERIAEHEDILAMEHERELERIRRQAEDVSTLAAAMRGKIDVWLIDRSQATEHDGRRYHEPHIDL